jgi:anti-sigma28 factor (negative regulator of flagellin synthesis)
MATRRYKISVGETYNSVTEEAGAAVNSDIVELTVELAATAVNTASGQRIVNKEEVLDAVEKIKAHIIKGNWPPA